MSTATTARDPVLELLDHGQSLWYDYVGRGLITSGELARLIAEDSLRGITSNPSLWEKAIAGSTDYADKIAVLRAQGATDPKAQARGDFEVLAQRGRRALRIHIGEDVGAGLATIRSAVEQALS